MEANPYRAAIESAMAKIGEIHNSRFVGYNVKHGRFAGTLKNVPEERLIETPVAENLMAGIALGFAVMGYLPVLLFERADFLLNSLDCLVNHLNHFEAISRGEFAPKVIIRVVVGNTGKPLFTGLTHTQNLAQALAKMVGFPVHELGFPFDVEWAYREAIESKTSMALFEFKDLM